MKYKGILVNISDKKSPDTYLHYESDDVWRVKATPEVVDLMVVNISLDIHGIDFDRYSRSYGNGREDFMGVDVKLMSLRLFKGEDDI